MWREVDGWGVGSFCAGVRWRVAGLGGFRRVLAALGGFVLRRRAGGRVAGLGGVWWVRFALFCVMWCAVVRGGARWSEWSVAPHPCPLAGSRPFRLLLPRPVAR